MLQICFDYNASCQVCKKVIIVIEFSFISQELFFINKFSLGTNIIQWYSSTLSVQNLPALALCPQYWWRKLEVFIILYVKQSLSTLFTFFWDKYRSHQSKAYKTFKLQGPNCPKVKIPMGFTFLKNGLFLVQIDVPLLKI